MNTDFLLGRRRAVIDRHRTLEGVPGSGYHKDDSQAREMRDRGLAPLSDRPVAIQHDATVYLVGPCVAAVRAALAAYLAAAAAAAAEAARFAQETGTEPDAVPAFQNQVEAVAKAVCAGAGEVLELSTAQWNCCTYALGAQKVPAVLTGLKDSAT